MNPASMPQIVIPRSKFLQEYDHVTSFLHGDLIPLDCFEVLPGDDFSVHKAAAEIIMSTPIAPMMANIKTKVVAFFVPTRLLWEHTEEFYGANKTSAGPQTTVYKIPTRSLFRNGVPMNSVSHYLGKPYCSFDTNKYNYGKVSILKERAYWFIWSEWYRAQQIQAPFIMNKGDGDGNAVIGTIAGWEYTTNRVPAKVCKQIDIFTAATTSPQYGSAVELPLGSFAPVVMSTDTPGEEFEGLQVRNAGTTGLNRVALNTTNPNQTPLQTYIGVLGDTEINSGVKLEADLSSATAAKINDIRYAFQLQKYLERANFGSRFFEVLAVHYGITSPDSRLQRPEYLGGKSAPIVIRPVLSQAGYEAGTTSKVGQLGAVSQTYIDYSGLFSKGFVEPGYVMILLSTNHERLYAQGIMREDYKTDRFEFYSPEFNNLGDQAILNKEIMLTGDDTDEQVFGYQGHWDEYRYRLKRVSGLMDPNVPNSLDFWTLAEKFSSRPSLSESFIVENRDNISRALVTGESGPDYLCDFYCEYMATREMSMYAIPGLIDHFGAL